MARLIQKLHCNTGKKLKIGILPSRNKKKPNILESYIISKYGGQQDIIVKTEMLFRYI